MKPSWVVSLWVCWLRSPLEGGELTMSSPTPTSVVTDAVDGLEGDLLAVAAVGLGIGAVIFAIRKGWGLVKSFVR